MDLARAAAFHASDKFDAFDFDAQTWLECQFEGKLGYAPEAFAINNLSSRKRMLFTAGKVQPPSSVIRLNEVAGVYLVEGRQGDSYRGGAYQNVYNLHEVAGTAQIWRAAPTGPNDDPGWAVNAKLQDTFADVLFQRVPMDQEQSVDQYGLYSLYLPSDAPLQDKDTVRLNGQTFFVFEVYKDQGLVSARATNKPDLRQNIVYVSITNGAYDPAQLKNPKTVRNYNVTAQVEQVKNQEVNASNVTRDVINVLVQRTWLAVTPKIDDEIQVFGKTYRIGNIKQNQIMDSWEITAAV